MECVLNTGHKIPRVGLGTFLLKGEKEIEEALTTAINAGYRHFDLADFYQNENELGIAFEKIFQKGLVKREELFITTKVFILIVFLFFVAF
jgi:diketogulonate reductase-like aldo/keto reductase